MEKYLCMAKHLFPKIDDDEWREGGLPVEATSTLGAAIDFVLKHPVEADIEMLTHNQGKRLLVWVKRASTGEITEVSLSIEAAYRITSASEVCHIMENDHASV